MDRRCAGTAEECRSRRKCCIGSKLLFAIPTYSRSPSLV